MEFRPWTDKFRPDGTDSVHGRTWTDFFPSGRNSPAHASKHCALKSRNSVHGKKIPSMESGQESASVRPSRNSVHGRKSSVHGRNQFRPDGTFPSGRISIPSMDGRVPSVCETDGTFPPMDGRTLATGGFRSPVFRPWTVDGIPTDGIRRRTDGGGFSNAPL